jgi:hypothetical protein
MIQFIQKGALLVHGMVSLGLPIFSVSYRLLLIPLPIHFVRLMKHQRVAT